MKESTRELIEWFHSTHPSMRRVVTLQRWKDRRAAVRIEYGRRRRIEESPVESFHIRRMRACKDRKETIRTMLNNGSKAKDIATFFSLTKATVYQIIQQIKFEDISKSFSRKED